MADEQEMNGLGEFADRFEELANEAQQFGVHVCIVLHTEDPISRKTQINEIVRCGRVTAIGMLQTALWGMQERR